MRLIFALALPFTFRLAPLFIRASFALRRTELQESGFVVFPRVRASTWSLFTVNPVVASHTILFVLRGRAVGLRNLIRAVPFLP